jgi:hypothetical protein
MNPETLTLTPFFEADPEAAAVPDRYLAGFRDASGEPWGVVVPLDAVEVRRAAGAAERRWNVAMFQIDGIVHPQPADWDVGDEEYGAMLEAGCLEHVAIDDLVEDAIEMERNEPDDETLPGLKKLRERLERCITMVDKGGCTAGWARGLGVAAGPELQAYKGPAFGYPRPDGRLGDGSRLPQELAGFRAADPAEPYPP